MEGFPWGSEEGQPWSDLCGVDERPRTGVRARLEAESIQVSGQQAPTQAAPAVGLERGNGYERQLLGRLLAWSWK